MLLVRKAAIEAELVSWGRPPVERNTQMKVLPTTIWQSTARLLRTRQQPEKLIKLRWSHEQVSQVIMLG